MSPILPLHAPYVHQPEVRFIDQRGRLNRVLGTLVVQVPPRNPVQFRIRQLDDLPDGSLVPGAPGAQKLRDLWRWPRGNEVGIFPCVANYINELSGHMEAGRQNWAWTLLGGHDFALEVFHLTRAIRVEGIYGTTIHADIAMDPMAQNARPR